jgi:succinate-semialdehyde dehydrogenase/glutarate-semialdehyde dehydrogenase
MTDTEVDERIAFTDRTFSRFRKLTFAERAIMMQKAAVILEDEIEACAKLMTTEMGRTFRSAVDEVLKCALTCRYYAENAERFRADKPIQTNATRSYVKYQPMGIILVVMPWNYPFWQVFRFIAPGQMAKNVGLLKYASNVPQSALKIEEILLQAGFPEGAFQTLLIGSDKVDRILEDPRIAAATLTGSVQAGVKVGVQHEESKRWYSSLVEAIRSSSCPRQTSTRLSTPV